MPICRNARTPQNDKAVCFCVFLCVFCVFFVCFCVPLYALRVGRIRLRGTFQLAIVFFDSQEFATRRLGKLLNGSWRLSSLLAVGGTSWVYVADAPWGGKVAVKVLHSALAADPSTRERFVREAKIVNQIRHEGVVPIDDDGAMEDGTPFLVMALLDGETLEDRSARKGGKLPLSEVMWVADRVLDTLYAAHKAGVVHRDIKPENVFLTSDGRIKLLDFGTARLQDQALQYTQAGTLLGTVDYMPPEQARGETDKVGVQTDLWSVGATIFRLLSGRSVHNEARMIDKIFASMSKHATPLKEVAPHVPDSIALMVDFALAFDAPQRWPNALAMRHALMVATSEVSSKPSATGTNESSLFRAPRAPRMSTHRPPMI